MKLHEIEKLVGMKLRFKSPTDEKFYYKYKNKDCVIAYCKANSYSKYAIVIEGKDKYYALQIGRYFFHIYSLKNLFNLIKITYEEPVILNESKYQEAKRQVLAEAL